MEEHLHEVTAEWKQRAYIDQGKYEDWYRRSIADPNAFWAEHGKRIHWMKPFHKVKNTSFGPGNVSIKWFEDGTTNAAYNCVDRHLEKRANQTAIIWEGDDPSESRKITYRELHDEVCRFANILRNRNIGKGDTVTIYMPMIPEAAYAILACARIGAVHSVVFGGFSPDSLASRIEGCQSRVVITADEGLRGGRKVPLKANVDEALKKAPFVEQVIVVKRTGGAVDMDPARDVYYHDAASVVTHECPCEEMHAEDPLFILYTSGSTGAPKGVVHTTGGYLVYAAMTHQYVFDYHDGDIYWCTADVGWVTGHSYIIYGPLANGATTLMFEGIPNYPIDLAFLGSRRQAQGQHLLYRADGDPLADGRRRSAGEEDQPQVAAPARLGRRADQSRSMGMVLSRRRRQPMPDRRYVVADRDRRHHDHAAAGRDRAETGIGNKAVLRREARDCRCRRQGPRRRVRRQSLHRRFLAGPDAYRLWRSRTVRADLLRDLQGQVFHRRRRPPRRGRLLLDHRPRRRRDQRLRSPHGHRRSRERAGCASESRRKRRWSAIPHDIKGQGIYAYVTLMAGERPSEDLRKELVAWVRKEIGPIASPDVIQFAPGLPKTRSGKIMRRILRKIAENEVGALGDTSTLADPTVVDDLIKNRNAA